MALSRWGDKVEGLQTKLTPAEQVSVQARMLELTQMGEAIDLWLATRSNLFTFTVELVDAVGGYEVRCRKPYTTMNGEKMVAISRVMVGIAEIDANTKTSEQWGRFMAKVYHGLTSSITSELRENNAALSPTERAINTNWLGIEDQRMTPSLTANTAGMMDSVRQAAAAMNRFQTTAFQVGPSQDEEDAALESIRRSMGK